MIRAAAHGRLASDPRAIPTKTGTVMTVATLAVDLGEARDGEDSGPLWLGIIAFGRQAEELARACKGEPISATGRVKRNTWTDRATGEVREQLQIVADVILSARSARPSGGRKRKTSDQPAARQTAAPAAGPEFSDAIPF